MKAACNRIDTSVGWPSRRRSTPELDELQAPLFALMTYRVASGVLQHLLIRQSLRAVGRTDDTELTAFADGCPGILVTRAARHRAGS
jgi:hypothetical protein